ncbi:amidase family protein [Amycolatopsis sp. NPDC051372]|uniref:amidase family protein n=1 Tax=Amycolatopsis sp. NPDC051372 TaxID=3155669 RepID=UPI003434C160
MPGNARTAVSSTRRSSAGTQPSHAAVSSGNRFASAGLPALVVRGGFDAAGLPVGIQLTAAPWREELLLDTGELVQRLTGAVQHRWPENVNTTEKESPNVVPQR